MKEKRTQPQNKSGFKMSLGMKRALLTIIIALVAKMGLAADEYFNKKIVETFREPHPSNELYHAGVDQTGDGFVDLFIIVDYANRGGLSGRLAGLLKEGAVVSYEDRNKKFDSHNGFFYIMCDDLLEINGRSVRSLVTPESTTFPFEAARQKRLSAQPPASPSAEERRIAELEAELQRLRQQNR